MHWKDLVTIVQRTQEQHTPTAKQIGVWQASKKPAAAATPKAAPKAKAKAVPAKAASVAPKAVPAKAAAKAVVPAAKAGKAAAKARSVQKIGVWCWWWVSMLKACLELLHWLEKMHPMIILFQDVSCKWCNLQLPSLKLTQRLTIGLPKRKVAFQPSILRGYVSFREYSRSDLYLRPSDLFWWLWFSCLWRPRVPPKEVEKASCRPWLGKWWHGYHRNPPHGPF